MVPEKQPAMRAGFSVDLTGRVALVTGASSGIGATVAHALAASGAKVVLCGRRRARLDAVARAIEEAGGASLAAPMDVTDEASVRGAFDAAEAKFGRVDTVIANAGVGARGRSTDISAHELDDLIAVNFRGVFLTAREGAKRMIGHGSPDHALGRIIIISSVTAVSTDQSVSAYAATKAAILHLGKSFAREWIKLGVNVNVVLPGYVRTDMIDDLFEGAAGEKLLNAFPRRRLLREEDIAATVLYLSCDAAAAITGAAIVVDDGQML